MSSGKPKHLPLLYNPLLNAIFNNPQHAKSAIRSTISELSLNHNDYTILVPPAHILQNCTELSGSRLETLCYENDAFLKSHIIKTSAPYSTTTAPVTKVQSIIYNTMNGRQILVKNGSVFTGKGFKKSIRALVLSTDYFVTFCDYFPKGSKVMLLFIDDCLFGHKTDRDQEQPIEEPRQLERSRKTATFTFEELLRNFPLLSKAMSDSFYALFHHNNRKYEKLRAKTSVPLKDIRSSFMAMVEEAFAIVQRTVNSESADGERISRLLHNVTQNSNTDLNNLVHEYVELNVYDKVWMQLVAQYENSKAEDEGSPKMVLTPKVYEALSCLSLTQLDLPVEEPWHMNVLHARVAAAIGQFSKLNDPSVANRRQKIDLIRNTVKILAEGEESEDARASNLVIDADTLIGLLSMVVVHSKVTNLEAHIYYISHFGIDSLHTDHHQSEKHNIGSLNYILSNIDAVIYLFSVENSKENSTNHFQELSEASARNYHLWYTMQKGDLKELDRILDQVEDQYGSSPLPKDHFLRSRNINGESSLCFAIRSKNFELFKTFLERTACWFSVEDLLFDRNTTTDQTLLMIALAQENSEITELLLSTIMTETTKEEQALYYKQKDKSGRTLGHYLSHDLNVLQTIGPHIDWSVKDNNSHTPLFSICRHYDHHNYRLLVRRAFACVFEIYQTPLILDGHTDRFGNTFLHILARGIPGTQLCDQEKALMDVNQYNERLMSPSAVYVRYSRTENLKFILNHELFNFRQEDQKNFYNLLDYYSFSASKSSKSSSASFEGIERIVIDKYFESNFSRHNEIQLGVLNARYDGAAGDWIINTVFRKGDSNQIISTQYISIDKLRQFTKLQKMAFPQGFGLDLNTLWINHPSDKQTIPSCSKYRSNRLLELLTLYFSATHYLSKSSRLKFKKNFAIFCGDNNTSTLDMMKDISTAQENAKKRNGEVKYSSAQIQEIEAFINFTQADLQKYHLEVSKLNQYLTVASMKQCDLRHVFDILLRQIHLGSVSGLDIREYRSLDASYLSLQAFVAYLELSVSELLQNCRKLTEKLKLWTVIYSGIREINAELRHFEDQVPKHNSNEEVQEPQNGVGGSISRRSTTSLDTVPVETEESGSFFNFALIDSKKSKYKKLLLSKSEEVKKVMSLNSEIKIDHELIAAEISQFLSFRSGFISLGIRNFTRQHLLSLKSRSQELTKLLWSIRRQV